MVKIDTEKIQLGAMDTPATFAIRVANSRNTLPDYLRFNPALTPETLTNNSEYTTESLIESAQNTHQSFTDWYQITRLVFPNISSEDILKIYLSHNQDLRQYPEEIAKPVINSGLSEEIEALNLPIKWSLYTFWNRDYKEFLKIIDKKIRENKKIQKEWQSINRALTTADDSYTTPFIYDKVLIWYPTDMKKVMLEELLDDLHPNFEVPMGTVKGVYKLSSSIETPPETWKLTADKFLCFKVIRPEIISPLDETKLKLSDYYYDLFAVYEEEEQKIMLGINAHVESQEMDASFSLLRLKNCLRKYRDFQFGEAKYESVSGSVLVPNIDFNKFVFADEVMINPVFRHFLDIDESQKASKAREAIFVKFFDPSHPEFGIVSLSLVGKKAIRNDPDLRLLDDKSQFELGSRFVKLKVLNAKDINAANHAIEIVGKLFSLYKEDEENIIEIYQEFIPDFELVIEDEMEKELDEKYIASDLFVAKYTRSCTHPPRLITERKEAKNLEKKGIQVIKFPRTEAEGAQYYYTCDEYPEYSYIGLQENKTLSNRQQYPYIPCCFKKDQTKKKASPYRIYYHDEEVKEDTIQQHIITTNKFAPRNKFARIPKNLEKILELFDNTYGYLRKGVSDSKSSFLECILEVKQPEIIDIVDEERLEYLNEERLKLAENLSPIIFQSNPGQLMEDIKRVLTNTDIYLDPKKFAQFFAQYYKINIFMIKRDIEKNEGHVLYPYSKWVLFTPVVESNVSIIIFEHDGAESDNARYPRCELVVKWTKNTTEVIYEFDNTDPVIRGIKKVYQQSRIYLQDCETFITPQFTIPGKVISQFIDNYGKTRIVQIETKNKNRFEIATEPLPIMNAPVKTQVDIIWKNIKPAQEILKFIESINGKIIGQTQINNDIYEINFLYENYIYSMIMEGKLENIDEVTIRNIGISFSLISLYNNLYRCARYLESLVLWGYSRSIGNLEEINPTSVKTWIKNNIIINENIDEMNINILSPLLGEKSIVWNGSKIVVPNTEIKKRLHYHLLLMIRRMSFESVRNYKNKTWADNYYTGISDYQTTPLTLIFSDKEFFTRKANNFQIYSKVRPELSGAYYLQNPRLCQGEIVLLLPFENLEKAIETSIHYNENKVIKSNPDGIFDENKSYNIYLYFNVNKITVRRNNDSSELSPSVLAFKKNGQIKYYSVIKTCPSSE